MTEKAERVRRALAGEKNDRIPFSLWTHFPGMDLDPESLADMSYRFYREFNLDFIKNMPNGMFSVEDWGCTCDYSAIPKGGVAEVTGFAVRTVADWDRLTPPDPGKGAMGRELRSLELLLGKLKGEAPVIATIFSPITTAEKLSNVSLGQSMREAPEAFKRGLASIAEVTAGFALKALELGCAGVYFASQVSSTLVVSEDEYREFGIPYDMMVLEALKGKSWFDVMHLHGNDVMFDLLSGYPVQGISWHVWETAPGVQDFVEKCPGKSVVGGLRRFKITDGDLGALEEDISETTRLTGGKRLFLAPGCVVRYPFDKATFAFIRDRITQSR